MPKNKKKIFFQSTGVFEVTGPMASAVSVMLPYPRASGYRTVAVDYAEQLEDCTVMNYKRTPNKSA
jgi:hypothetical protein